MRFVLHISGGDNKQNMKSPLGTYQFFESRHGVWLLLRGSRRNHLVVRGQGWLSIVSQLELFEEFLNILSLMMSTNRGRRGVMTSTQTKTAPQTVLQVLHPSRTRGTTGL